MLKLLIKIKIEKVLCIAIKWYLSTIIYNSFMCKKFRLRRLNMKKNAANGKPKIM